MAVKDDQILELADNQANGAEKYKHIIGNLPFGIATALLLRWLRAIATRSGIFSDPAKISLVLMFQSEVADVFLYTYNYRES